MSENKTYQDVVVVNHNNLALELSLDLKNKSQAQQRAAFGGTHGVGHFYLNTMEKHPDSIMECVVSPEGDSVTSVYKVHPSFASAGELIKVRADLIAQLSMNIGLSPHAIGIEDAARGRSLGLSELSTGQLIDMLTDANKTGKSIVVSDSHSTSGAGGIVLA